MPDLNDGKVNNLISCHKQSLFFSISEFAFPLERQAVFSNGITTYVYKNNSTYPILFEFISELLHKPIVLEGTKFGPVE